jgi:xanthine dehydrogenase accessory factor
MKIIAETALRLLKNGESFAQATILTSSGSTPREPGAAMLIRRDGSIVGTVGGGVLEAHILKTAKRVIDTGIATVEEYLLEESGAAAIGAICGGRAQTLIEFIDANDVRNTAYFEQLFKACAAEKQSFIAALIPHSISTPRCECLILSDGTFVGSERYDRQLLDQLWPIPDLDDDSLSLDDTEVYLFPVGSDGTVYIFGAGHCGEKLAHVLHTVGFGTVVIDDRADFANSARFPDADEILVPESMTAPFDTLAFGADSYIVIVTRGHVHDELVLRKALKTQAGYVGMIGSRKKRETIYQHLLADGFTSEDIQRVHSPIGLPIGAESPEEIAVSITAELIQFRAARKAK